MAQMLMDLGANVYSEDFEQHFLGKAAEFYQVCLRLFVLCRGPLLQHRMPSKAKPDGTR